MARKWKLSVMAAAVTVLLAACSSHAAPAKELKELKIGDPAPKWSKIVGVDDKEHSLAEYKKAKTVVMVFTCNHCPVAKMYEDRLIALQKQYQDKGVQFVAVNSNSVKVVPADSFEKMKQRAAGKDLGAWRTEKGPFNFPYLHDAAQKMAHDYGAKVTPHVFMLDKDRKVVYVGAVDDNNNAEKAETHYLRDALDAVLAGKKPPQESTRPRGCSVKYEK